MNDRSLHGNTKVLLSAWRRMNITNAAEAEAEPKAVDHPELVSNLFVITAAPHAEWRIRSAGDSVTQLLGRELANYNFLDLWSGPDREMMEAFLESVRADGAPGVIRGTGETMTAEQVEFELTLMPLARDAGGVLPYRLLGLYQILDNPRSLKGRPLWRHRLSMLVPPNTQRQTPGLRVIASNA